MALIFGIAGALRRIEFVNLKVTDITESEDLLHVKILETKNKLPRSFIITGGLYQICKQYIQARPQRCQTDRFFLKYSKGKCTQQAMGINKFGAMPRDVAVYLKLSNADDFTGHSFRRTSATLLVDAGADITALKRHGGWKSSTVAEGYIADSLNNKRKICEQISSGIVLNKEAKIVHDVPADSINAVSTSSITDPNHPVPLYEPNVNIATTENVIVETGSTSNLMKPLQSFEPNGNITFTENTIVETSSTSNHIQRIISPEPKFSILYDPSIGLYVYHAMDESVNNSFEFYNCNVTINDGSHKSFVFNNCNITNKAVQIENIE